MTDVIDIGRHRRHVFDMEVDAVEEQLKRLSAPPDYDPDFDEHDRDCHAAVCLQLFLQSMLDALICDRDVWQAVDGFLEALRATRTGAAVMTSYDRHYPPEEDAE
jgi:hypothetical protein